jgi:hypothetical protein
MVHTWKRMRGLRYRLARDRAMALGAVATAVVFARGCFVEIADPAEPGDTDGGGTTGSGGSTSGTGGSVANGGSSGDAGAAGGDADDGDAPDASCVSGKKNCGGTCVAIDDPDFGCATSGCMPCDLANTVSARCTGNACAPDVCEPTYADCDGNGLNGCELGFGSGIGPVTDGADDPVLVPHVTPAIVVDGDLADWSSVLVRPLESACIDCQPSGQPGGQPPPKDGQGIDGGVIVFSNDVPPAGDLTAHFAMAWSNSGLDIAVLTLDDEFVPPSPGAGLSSLRQDGLELFVDVAPFGPDYENGRDRHVFLGSGDLNTWEPNIATTVSENDIARASSRRERCQIVELRIRWNPYLGTTPEPGTEYGFTIAVNDWDTAAQVTRREHQVFWRTPSKDYAFKTVGFPRVVLE